MELEHSTQSFIASPTQLGSDAELLLSLLRQKLWADTELLKTVLALPQLASVKEGEYVTAIIRHFHTVDCIFKAHLLGVPHGYTSANPTEPATLAELERPVRELSQWYVDYVQTLNAKQLAQALHVKFTDGEEQRLTRSEMLLHVVLHGAGHRGNIGIILRLLGAEPAPDRFSSWLRHAAA